MQPAQMPAATPESRDIITPYAFHVHPQLLGLPLARPWQRGLAIALDGLAVAMLSEVPGGGLVVVTAIVLFRWAGRTRVAAVSHWRGALRWLIAAGALLGLIDLTGAIRHEIREGGDVHARAAVVKHSAALAELLAAIESGRCDRVDCARGPVLDFAPVARKQGWSEQESLKKIDELLDDLNLGKADLASLHEQFHQRFVDPSVQPTAAASALPKLPDPIEVGDDRPRYSIIGWAKGILDDLGIGLGWSALYFSAFTAWWRGQTPGKKLVGIRAVRLDGKPFTLWTSFERYGGYGAGFATGLLGFLQVFWDRNRQAIHDKISETVVIVGDVPRDMVPEAAGAVPGIG
ncbi:MAG TPA: RDD family protein [Nevskiaceae bacterium]|nr:RDD family protein [Nevskiaceae bacterium]